MLETIEDESAARPLSSNWNALVENQLSVPIGLGLTSNFDLSMLAWKTLLPHAALRVYVQRERGSISAILPCYTTTERVGPLSYREIGLIPELYPGRTGVIYDQSQPEYASMLLRSVLERRNDWDAFMMTFTAGDPLEQDFLDSVSRQKLAAHKLSEIACPYLLVPEQWDDLLAQLGSRFRRNFRSRERKLQELGSVAVTSFTRPEDCESFLRGVVEVEKQSWKEVAGTSLTKKSEQLAYHEQMTRVCAANGTFQGFHLTLDGRPIAHIIGIRSRNVFLNLKSSFADEYRKFGLGTLIKALAIRDVLCGTIKYWDFVGEAQDHKMQWTDKTYTLRKYVVFSRSIKGRLLRLRLSAADRLRKRRPHFASAKPLNDGS